MIENNQRLDTTLPNTNPGQAFEQIPPNRTRLVVRLRAGQRRDNNGGHACGDRHLDRHVGAHVQVVQQVG